MKTICVASLFLLASSSAQARLLQDANNDTAITTDGDIEVLISTAAPTEPPEDNSTAAPTETAKEGEEQSESAPTDASVTPTNATDGGLFSGVGEWVGNAADTVTGTVANATSGFTDWLGNVVNSNSTEEEPGKEPAEEDETAKEEPAEETAKADETAKAESDVEAAVESDAKDDTPDSGVVNLMSASVFVASAAAAVALF
jgi:hypothetical protein